MQRLTLTVVIALAALNATLFAQIENQDSLEAVFVRFDVRSGMDPRYRELLDDPFIREVVFLVRDPFVIIKATATTEDDKGTFMLFDTERRHAYRCVIRENRVYALFERELIQNRPTAIIDTASKEIAGIECTQALVTADGQQLVTWFTDILGTDFYLFGDVPGIPLYYEQADKTHGKLIYEASEIYRITVPSYIFDTGSYGLLLEPRKSNREALNQISEPDYFSKKDVEGDIFDLRDQKGQITVLTFWDPAIPAHRIDAPTLAMLNMEFTGDVTFVALNPYKGYSLPTLVDTAQDRRIHIPSAKQLFRSYGVDAMPRHVILDSENRIRFIYTGVFGLMLEGILRDDLESLGAGGRSSAR